MLKLASIAVENQTGPVKTWILHHLEPIGGKKPVYGDGFMLDDWGFLCPVILGSSCVLPHNQFTQ